MAQQILSDVVVLDLTWHVAGPYCTKMLADYGAEVIKIEKPPEGDPARRWGPFPGDSPNPEASGTFLFLNTNKKGITLNLKTESGKAIFKDLAKDAHIVVESFSPGVMERLGIGYEELAKINPKLVMTSISNFGQTAPYRNFKASDIVLFALGGPMYITGVPEREPVNYAYSVIPCHLGYLAAAATLVAFYVAEQQGTGQHVDFSMMEALQSNVNWQLTYHTTYQYRGITPGREVTAFGMLPTGGYPCKDGWVYMIVDPGWWPKLVAMMGMPELMEQFPNLFDATRKDEFDAIFMPWLLERTKQEITEMAGAIKLNIGAINTIEDVLNDKHLNSRGAFAEIEHPVAGTLTYPGRPFVAPETPWILRSPAPLLGEHNEEIYCKRLGYTEQDLVKLKQIGVI